MSGKDQEVLEIQVVPGLTLLVTVNQEHTPDNHIMKEIHPGIIQVAEEVPHLLQAHQAIADLPAVAVQVARQALVIQDLALIHHLQAEAVAMGRHHQEAEEVIPEEVLLVVVLQAVLHQVRVQVEVVEEGAKVATA